MSLSESLGVEDVFKFADVTSEEGGWLVVTSNDESDPVAWSDAVSFSSVPDANYDRFISEDDLQGIEEDLYPEDVVRMLFLAIDETPALVLQKCVVKMSQSGKKNMVDSFSEWAHKISERSWKAPFLESLAVIGRLDILCTLGCDDSQIRKLQRPVYLSSLKVSLNQVCCSLKEKEVDQLIRYVWQRHLPNRPVTNFPDGVIIKQLLELHILFWMQEGIMDLTDLSVLVDALESIGKHRLKEVLIGQTSSSSASLRSSSPGGHSKVVSVSSMPGIPASYVYPNDKGVCVIFNQEQFWCQNEACGLKKMPYHGVRHGSSKDAENLQRVFHNFQCRRKIIKDAPSGQIKTCLTGLANAHDLGQFDFLVVCFLSHGGTSDDGRQFIYSSDCKSLYVDELISMFEGDKCRGMRGKMKMIITQSCQGQNMLQPLQADGLPDPRGSRSSTSSSESSSRPRGATAQSDFLFCQATTPGHKAYRDPRRGSFYIMRLCEVLESRGHLEEVTLCIKDVHKLLIAQPIELGDDRIECGIQPQMIDRTQGRFRFKRVPEAARLQ